MNTTGAPVHTAIIMDGNGRWATKRGLPRLAGHEEGAKALRRAVSAAPALGIEALTLYAFSTDNWGRPEPEVTGLMTLFHRYLLEETPHCVTEGIRLSVIGRRDRLGPLLRGAVVAAEMATRGGARLHLRLAIDYSAREALMRAAYECAGNASPTREQFRHALGRALGGDEPAPDVDLLIRTGGEQRLSDFLLWESAYAELVFLQRPWPEFGERDLAQAVAIFKRRDRRFGRLATTAAAR